MQAFVIRERTKTAHSHLVKPLLALYAFACAQRVARRMRKPSTSKIVEDENRRVSHASSLRKKASSKASLSMVAAIRSRAHASQRMQSPHICRLERLPLAEWRSPMAVVAFALV